MSLRVVSSVRLSRRQLDLLDLIAAVLIVLIESSPWLSWPHHYCPDWLPPSWPRWSLIVSLTAVLTDMTTSLSPWLSWPHRRRPNYTTTVGVGDDALVTADLLQLLLLTLLLLRWLPQQLLCLLMMSPIFLLLLCYCCGSPWCCCRRCCCCVCSGRFTSVMVAPVTSPL